MVIMKTILKNYSFTTNPSKRNTLKSILLITLFFGTFFASTGSFLLRRFALDQQGHTTSTSVKLLFSLVSCFGAGVFLATCLLDLLPDSMHYIKQAEKMMGHEMNFPLPSFCVAFGFLLVLLLEQTLLYAHKRNWISNNRIEGIIADQEASELIRTRSHSHENNEDNAGEEDSHFDPQTHSTFRALLLVFALSLHALFEGLSIGMISDVSILLQIFFALLIHKTIVGFSLGIRLVQSKLDSVKIILSCGIFSGQVLIGGFLGLAIMDVLSGETSIFFISGILQAIACGTFLYLTVFEILPHELNNHSNIPLKMLSLLIGFGMIAGVIALFPEDLN